MCSVVFVMSIKSMMLYFLIDGFAVNCVVYILLVQHEVLLSLYARYQSVSYTASAMA